jgi:hypothetical protein
LTRYFQAESPRKPEKCARSIIFDDCEVSSPGYSSVASNSNTSPLLTPAYSQSYREGLPNSDDVDTEGPKAMQGKKRRQSKKEDIWSQSIGKNKKV